MVTENSELVYDCYKVMDDSVERVRESVQEHHPHGLKDVTIDAQFYSDVVGAKK